MSDEPRSGQIDCIVELSSNTAILRVTSTEDGNLIVLRLDIEELTVLRDGFAKTIGLLQAGETGQFYVTEDYCACWECVGKAGQPLLAMRPSGGSCHFCKKKQDGGPSQDVCLNCRGDMDTYPHECKQ